MPTFRKPGRDGRQSIVSPGRAVISALAAGLLTTPTADAAPAFGPGMPQSSTALTVGAAIVLIIVFIAAVRWRRRRATRQREQDALGSIDLFHLDTAGFIALLQDGYHRQGFEIEPQPPGDDPEDFLLQYAGGRELVRCRYWRARRVGADMVTALVRSLSRSDARRGVLVTTGEFTPEAIVVARRAGISLLEGARLRRLIDDLNVDWQSRRPGRQRSPTPAQLTPACPKCASPMVARHTGDTSRPGEAFWGCGRWPECTGILLDEELEVVARDRCPAAAAVSGRG